MLYTKPSPPGRALCVCPAKRANPAGCKKQASAGSEESDRKPPLKTLTPIVPATKIIAASAIPDKYCFQHDFPPFCTSNFHERPASLLCNMLKYNINLFGIVVALTGVDVGFHGNLKLRMNRHCILKAHLICMRRAVGSFNQEGGQYVRNMNQMTICGSRSTCNPSERRN